jgi:hypothetical protein
MAEEDKIKFSYYVQDETINHQNLIPRSNIVPT